MCNPSKKTIKKIERMLESRCKESRDSNRLIKALLQQII